jgi:hypothetical protein
MKNVRKDILKTVKELQRNSQLASGASLKTKVVRDKTKYTRKTKHKSVEI